MLPTQHQPASIAASSSRELIKFVVQSSDVLEELRVGVSEEGSDKVIWYKERFLTDDEIVDNVVENATSTLRWTIHRPKRGWYIKIQSPSSPSICTTFAPVPPSSSSHADGALWFPCRTLFSPLYQSIQTPALSSAGGSAKSSMETVTSSSETAVHSYPPTPPAVDIGVHAFSPSSIHAQLKASLRPHPSSQTQVTQFCLAPHSAPHAPETENKSFLTRALSLFQNHKPSHAASFTICPIPSAALSSSAIDPSSAWHLATPIPLLTFHDRTPIFTVRSTTGLLEIDAALEGGFGVDRSFWIAVALAYMDFLEEREGYLAAASD